MLQQYIPGGDESVWMFNGYFDRKSACVAGLTGKKLRQHPVHTGATSLGICLSNNSLRETTSAFMGALGYQGIVDIGYRYDARDGRYKVLDINPRIGATFRLFVGMDGTDVARLLYRDLTGQPLPAIAHAEGRKWLDEHRDFFAARQYRREGSLTIGTWLRSLRGVRETAWFARDDLRPAFRMISEIGWRTLRKAIRVVMSPFRGDR
jgi:predicted ATP-grasp superfamily ATP-dependent carboligase